MLVSKLFYAKQHSLPPLLKIKLCVTVILFPCFSQELQNLPETNLSWISCLCTMSQQFSTFLEIPQCKLLPFIGGNCRSKSVYTRKHTWIYPFHRSHKYSKYYIFVQTQTMMLPVILFVARNNALFNENKK